VTRGSQSTPTDGDGGVPIRAEGGSRTVPASIVDHGRPIRRRGPRAPASPPRRGCTWPRAPPQAAPSGTVCLSTPARPDGFRTTTIVHPVDGDRRCSRRHPQRRHGHTPSPSSRPPTVIEPRALGPASPSSQRPDGSPPALTVGLTELADARLPRDQRPGRAGASARFHGVRWRSWRRVARGAPQRHEAIARRHCCSSPTAFSASRKWRRVGSPFGSAQSRTLDVETGGPGTVRRAAREAPATGSRLDSWRTPTPRYAAETSRWA